MKDWSRPEAWANIREDVANSTTLPPEAYTDPDYHAQELAAADHQCATNKGLSSSEEQKVAAMLAFSTESSVNAVSRLYHFAGAAAIFNSSVLQRCFRDAHGSAMHHVTSNVAYDKYGQELLATRDPAE